MSSYLQCNDTVSLESFFQQILHEPTKIALIGAGCSVATEPVASISDYYNITQVSLYNFGYNISS